MLLALTGAGRGILAVPLLVFGVNLSVAQAGAIALIAVGKAAGIGALLGLRAGIVRYKAALLIAGAGMLLSPEGRDRLVHSLPRLRAVPSPECWLAEQ